MTSDLDPTAAAVQTAQRNRRDAAEACDVRYRRLLAEGNPSAQIHEQYLQEGREIDAAFEHQVEPWRQHFVATNPGQPLPDFLVPGFGSFSDRQKSVKPPTQPLGHAAPVAGPPSAKRSRSWLMIAAVSIVALLILGGCIASLSSSESSKSGKSSSSTVSMEDKYVALVRQETDLNTVSDEALISAAKSACTSLSSGATVTEVLVAIMDTIPIGSQEDVIRSVGFGISAFCPDQASKVR